MPILKNSTGIKSYKNGNMIKASEPGTGYGSFFGFMLVEDAEKSDSGNDPGHDTGQMITGILCFCCDKQRLSQIIIFP